MNSLNWKYVKPLIHDETIKRFEENNNISFPEDVRKCIEQNNGGRPNKKTFDTTRTKERVIKGLLSFNEEDLETVYVAFDIVKKEIQNIIPIASDPFGNFICYNSITGNIVLWLHETNSTEEIAENFTEFLYLLR